MVYTTLTKKALNICYEAHKNQLDKGGIPYVFHPLAVAENFNDENLVCIALLHDVLEDTDYRLDDLLKQGFPKQVLDAVICITRPKHMDYMDYIKIVKTNDYARRVKLADIIHNMDTTRIIPEGEELTESVIKRIEKYKKAKLLLEDTY